MDLHFQIDNSQKTNYPIDAEKNRPESLMQR